MGSDQSSLSKAASILEAVLSGDTDPVAALNQWPSDAGGQLLLDARHRLDHYASDLDIHKTNPAYEKKQRENLADMLDRIRKEIQ